MNDPFSTRRRLAWAVLLGGFTIFLAICISLPFLANWYFQNSRQPLVTSVATNSGTLALMQSNGETVALLAADPPRELETGAELLTNAADTALFTAFSPVNEQLLLRGQLYGNTRIELREAQMPRYSISNDPTTIALSMSNGRFRVTIPPAEGEVLYNIKTPQGMVNISQPGQFSLEVNNDETIISVLDGQIEVVGGETLQFPLELNADERAVLQFDSPPSGPLTTERNLIANSNFDSDFSEWSRQEWNVELEDQPTGETRLVFLAGEPTLRFSRLGLGHADASVRQIINQDVTDFTSLRLLISLRINTQSLGVCGTVGSECPITVRINYEDLNGTDLTWEQGYFANGQFAQDTPDTCIYCSPPKNPHKPVLPGRVYVEEIDLLASLARQGFSPPRFIHSVSIIAAGHTFESDVIDIAILGRES